jgi:hypothetical protein
MRSWSARGPHQLLGTYREHSLLMRTRANVLFPEFFCPLTRRTCGLGRLAASSSGENGNADKAASQDGGNWKAHMLRWVSVTLEILLRTEDLLNGETTY